MSESKRVESCCVCGKPVHIETKTVDHAPEMLKPAPDAWLGVMRTESGGLDVVASCGDDCLVKMFAMVLEAAGEAGIEKGPDTQPQP